jgi:hypothetical protein
MHYLLKNTPLSSNSHIFSWKIPHLT